MMTGKTPNIIITHNTKEDEAITAYTTFIMGEAISYKVVQRVLSSWELASQKHSSREEIGMQVLLTMFRTRPETKQVFGFTPKQNVEENPMLRMGAMIHGTNIYSMLDQALSLVGPDIETLVEFLETLGEKHSRRGVKIKYFTYLCDSVREVLATILGDKYSLNDDTAWKELLELLVKNITKNMTKDA